MKANKNKYGFQKVLVSRRGGRKKNEILKLQRKGKYNKDKLCYDSIW